MSTVVEITTEDIAGLRPRLRVKAIEALKRLYLRLTTVNRVDAFSRRECMDNGFDPKYLTTCEARQVLINLNKEK